MNFGSCLIVGVRKVATSSCLTRSSLGMIFSVYLYASRVTSSQYDLSSLYNSRNLAFLRLWYSSWFSAIIALGGTPSKSKVRDMGIDGKLYPIESVSKEKSQSQDLFGDIDNYIPIQVKRTTQVGRPDIDAFQTAMKRDGRDTGIFVGFGFSRDADKEIRRVKREQGMTIKKVTVGELVQQQMNGIIN